MKNVLLLLALAMTGCSEDYYVTVHASDLLFKAGDKVTTRVSFYSSCRGMIVGYSSLRNTNQGPDYRVSFYCPNKIRVDDVFINESDLNLFLGKF